MKKTPHYKSPKIYTNINIYRHIPCIVVSDIATYNYSRYHHSRICSIVLLYLLKRKLTLPISVTELDDDQLIIIYWQITLVEVRIILDVNFYEVLLLLEDGSSPI